MKIKQLLLSFLIFTFIYIGLIFLTGSFLMTWGAKRNIFEKLYVEFIAGPFDYSKSLWLILLNSIFWFFIIYFIVIGIKNWYY